MSYSDFGFGDENDLVTARVEKFKGEKDKKYRLSFAWWKKADDGLPNFDAGSPSFTGAKRLYIQNVGYVEYTPELEVLKIAPKAQIATVIVNWPVNKQGKVDMARLADKDYTVQPWIFSEDKFNTLKARHEEFHFGSNDITVLCTDAQFQKMDIGATQGSLLRKLVRPDSGTPVNETFVLIGREIIAQADRIAAGLKGEIARSMTLAQVREKLNGSPPSANAGGAGGGRSGGNSAVSEDDLNDLLG
jgi:hypothetical protein